MIYTIFYVKIEELNEFTAWNSSFQYAVHQDFINCWNIINFMCTHTEKRKRTVENNFFAEL